MLAVFIILAGTVLGVVLAMREIGKSNLADRREDPDKYYDYVYDPDVIRFNGETYRYNKDLTNFLFLGIDKPELYLRARIGVGDETNASRIARQQEYMKLFIEQARNKMLGDFPWWAKYLTQLWQALAPTSRGACVRG